MLFQLTSAHAWTHTHTHTQRAHTHAPGSVRNTFRDSLCEGLKLGLHQNDPGVFTSPRCQLGCRGSPLWATPHPACMARASSFGRSWSQPIALGFPTWGDSRPSCPLLSLRALEDGVRVGETGFFLPRLPSLPLLSWWHPSEGSPTTCFLPLFPHCWAHPGICFSSQRTELIQSALCPQVQ